MPDALAAVENGEIADAKSLVGLLWLERSRTIDAEPLLPLPRSAAPAGPPRR